MSCLGNLIWIILGGLFMSLGYLLLGRIYCVTIIGIPVGMQLFKLAGLALSPFGSNIEPRNGNLGVGSVILNIVDLTFFYRLETGYGFKEFLLTASRDAGDAEHFSGIRGKTYVIQLEYAVF